MWQSWIESDASDIHVFTIRLDVQSFLWPVDQLTFFPIPTIKLECNKQVGSKIRQLLCIK